jgi:hypothetical protein
MNTKLILAGQVYAIAKKTFQEEETVYVQFLNKVENGGVEIQQVKLIDKLQKSLTSEHRITLDSNTLALNI